MNLLNVLYADVAGTFPPTIKNEGYAFVLVDLASQMNVVYLLKDESDTVQRIQDCVEMLERMSGEK
ncbi:hypothetical protein HDU67_005395, partial [Dinochytrium kinnereticum]